MFPRGSKDESDGGFDGCFEFAEEGEEARGDDAEGDEEEGKERERGGEMRVSSAGR